MAIDQKRLVSRICCYISFLSLIGGITAALIYVASSSSPNELEFAVSNATLTRFDFSASDPNSTLSYSLELNLTVTNPNKKGGVYFEWFQVIAEYRAKTFGVTNLAAAPFHLGLHNTTALRVVLEGSQAVAFENQKDVERYNLEKESRVLRIDVKIALRLRNVTFRETTKYLEPSKINCNGLKIPLGIGNNSTTHGNNNSSTVVFKAKSCTDVYIFTSPYKYDR